MCACYDIHHGLNNGVGIARVWTYNQPACPDRFADIADAMRATKPGMSTRRRRPTRRSRPSSASRATAGSRRTGSTVGEYPKTRIGQGLVREPTDATIEPDDDELQKMADAHDRRPLHAGATRAQVTVETCKEILRDCAFDAHGLRKARARR